MKRHTFAFLVHPRVSIRDDLRRIWGPLGLIPDSVYNRALRNLPLPPLPISRVHLADQPEEVAGWIIRVPLGARQMLSEPRKVVQGKVTAAIDMAASLGADVVGLGALTASVTRGGALFRNRSDIAVTNGNALTAAMTVEGITRLTRRTQRCRPHIALVGATGSVGSAVARLVALENLTDRITLVARNQAKRGKLAAEMRETQPEATISVAGTLDAVREADLVVLLTSSADALLRSEHLKPGAIVLDDTQPRNTHPDLLTERPDLLIVDGGIVAVPGMQLQGADIGLPQGQAYACLAETMLLARAGQTDHFSLGNPTLTQIDRITTLARRERALGFELAEFQSFGQPLSLTERGHAPAQARTLTLGNAAWR